MSLAAAWVSLAAGRPNPQHSLAIKRCWVPVQVYDSLKQSPVVPDEVLDHYSNDGGESLLYELRFLPVDKRTPPALYIAENGLDTRVRQDEGSHSICPPGTCCCTSCASCSSTSARRWGCKLQKTGWTPGCGTERGFDEP